MPEIKHPYDAIVQVTRSLICGSDLHLYHGLVPDTRVGTFGHEFTGVVEEIGSGVQPAGLSGAVRRYAYKYSEATATHWMTFKLGDRIHVIQGKLNDLKQAFFPTHGSKGTGGLNGDTTAPLYWKNGDNGLSDNCRHHAAEKEG